MALTEDVKQQIQQTYRDVLAGKDIRARYGQRLMIAAIARRAQARARPWPI